jgi:CHASE3 domain sensor protein
MKTGSRSLFRNWKISQKLLVGYGMLVLLTLLSAGTSYQGSRTATDKITLTSDVRMPVALTASRAQADLLRMLADVRGYLVLGDREYWDNYRASNLALQGDLAELERLAPNLDALNTYRFNQLSAAYTEWSTLPGRLYALRNDQLEREPAYRLLATDGVRAAGLVLLKINGLIDAPRSPTAENVARLQDLARFEASFAAMLSGLRGYTTTRNRIFRQEYEVNLTDNQIVWDRIWNQHTSLPPDQGQVLQDVAQSRTEFLALVPQIFDILESDRWREDLYLFRTASVPLTDKMQNLLADMTNDQQALLGADLAEGSQTLTLANAQIVAGGLAAVLVGIVLAIVVSTYIARPIRRLRDVAERIRAGDLFAQARVESGDEIGSLATTFNNMTGQLRSILTQVRREKARADGLLNVVIPLGVQLASEKDFNQLLERTVLEAKAFCHADTGALYLPVEGNALAPVILRSDSRGLALGGTTGRPVGCPALPLGRADGVPSLHPVPVQAALAGCSVNLSDAQPTPDVSGLTLAAENLGLAGYPVRALLAIPLKNNAGQVLGVLELLNAQDPETAGPVPFDRNLQQMMESFSSLAVAALEAYIREQALHRKIQKLEIEIDEARRQQQVEEIVDSDFFQELQTRARSLRTRRRPAAAAE